MKIIDCTDADYAQALQSLYTRPACPPEIEERAKAIVEEVRLHGDKAVLAQIAKFDGVKLTASKLKVSDAEIKAAKAAVPKKTRDAVKHAIANIRKFSSMQIPKNWLSKPRPGVTLGEQFTPMERVGCYVPGGTAPLVSSAVHTVAVAKTAGVREIVAATPPRKDGTVNPATLYALIEAGATTVYKMGGATAVAALAYGTKTVPAVEKIVGPGNAYVAAAKRLVYGRVAIDMVAGPSEVMVVADGSVDPAWTAADMLAQAEHGSGLEQAVLVTDSKKVLKAVQKQMLEQSKTLLRQGPLQKVLANGIFLIRCSSMDEAADIAGKFAPEHLEVHCAEPRKFARKVSAAGAIFLGPWTPEPAGDFTAGPSHVLPTAGTAKFFHGISAIDFFRRSSLLEYTQAALEAELDDIELFAQTEGLDAHGRSASIRRKAPTKKKASSK